MYEKKREGLFYLRERRPPSVGAKVKGTQYCEKSKFVCHFLMVELAVVPAYRG
jgi:hypothetical protein